MVLMSARGLYKKSKIHAISVPNSPPPALDRRWMQSGRRSRQGRCKAGRGVGKGGFRTALQLPSAVGAYMACHHDKKKPKMLLATVAQQKKLSNVGPAAIPKKREKKLSNVGQPHRKYDTT